MKIKHTWLHFFNHGFSSQRTCGAPLSSQGSPGLRSIISYMIVSYSQGELEPDINQRHQCFSSESSFCV